MDIKLLVEHVGERLELFKMYRFWDMHIYVHVMYYIIYGVFGSSLLIESTDSMIILYIYAKTLFSCLFHSSSIISTSFLKLVPHGRKACSLSFLYFFFGLLTWIGWMLVVLKQWQHSCVEYHIWFSILLFGFLILLMPQSPTFLSIHLDFFSFSVNCF